jgi:predicted TPR repeat methyltransferase
VTLAPDLAVAWQRIGELSLAAGRLAAAHAPLAIAGRLAPDQPGLRNNLGVAARAAGRFDPAFSHFRAAILLDPAFAKPYANLAGLRRHRRQPAVADAARAVRLVADGAALLELGQACLAEGDAAAALDHFAGAAAQLPSQPEPLWLQIEALRRLGQDDQAIALAQRLLALDPADRFGAALALAQLGAAPLPERAPAAQVSRLYDQYAASFDANLLADLAYRAPALVMDALERLGRRGPFVAFDAGCGTGLMGADLRSRCSRLDGADLSAAMVARAAARGVYDDLVVGDLLAELAARPHGYDLVVAADVLIHLGDLRPVAAAAAAALRSGGAFAFTVERAEAGEVVLRASGRFAHGESHLRAAAAAAGLTVALCEAVATRQDAGRPVPGLLCVMTKP